MHHLGLIALEGAERPHVGRRLGQDHVPRVAEDAGDEVQALLGARGDDDVVGVRDAALLRHDLADLLTDARLALSGAVLHDLRAVLADHPGDVVADLAQG